MSIGMLLLLVWVHFVADFLAQTDKMAQNKSTSMKWLSIHIAVYSIFFLPFGVWFAIANGLAHMMTDYFTSRWTSYLWKKEERHWFFVVIGLDQAIHLSCIVLLFQWLV